MKDYLDSIKSYLNDTIHSTFGYLSYVKDLYKPAEKESEVRLPQYLLEPAQPEEKAAEKNTGGVQSANTAPFVEKDSESEQVPYLPPENKEDDYLGHIDFLDSKERKGESDGLEMSVNDVQKSSSPPTTGLPALPVIQSKASGGRVSLEPENSSEHTGSPPLLPLADKKLSDRIPDWPYGKIAIGAFIVAIIATLAWYFLMP